jgi:antirestriction protein ArdC
MANGEKTNKAMAILEDGVRNLTNDETWRAWLTTQAKFHHYSFGNCLLIAMQKPEARRVAGFNAWLDLGYAVRRGEKGIAILAPIVKKVTDEATGDESKRVVFFKTVYVFDVSQVDPTDRAKPIAPVAIEKLSGDAPADLFESLSTIVQAQGFTIEVVESIESMPDANGMTEHAKKKVTINGKLSPAMQCKTLAHELAHVMLHTPETQTQRNVGELEAESVAFVIMHANGITDNGYSFGYVANWAKEQSVELIRKRGEVIAKTAREILDQLAPQAVAA